MDTYNDAAYTVSIDNVLATLSVWYSKVNNKWGPIKGPKMSTSNAIVQ
jgi:hypothetical protein